MRQDEFGLKAPPAGLYDYSAEIRSGIDGFDNVTDADIEQFHALGFLVTIMRLTSTRLSRAVQEYAT